MSRRLKHIPLFDLHGNRVVIRYRCGGCGVMKEVGEFGLRKTARGLQNLTVCGRCRGKRVTKYLEEHPETKVTAVSGALDPAAAVIERDIEHMMSRNVR